MEYTNQQTPINTDEESPKLTPPTTTSSGLRVVSMVLALGTALVLYAIARRQRRPKTWKDRLEDTFSNGRDSMSQAVDNLEREVKRLRRAVEERIPNA